jgi:hypothetical protein
LMHGYPSSQGQVSQGTIDAYLMAVSGCSLEAVKRSCQQFLSGNVESHNNSFMPTAAELAANARQWDQAIAKVTADREIVASTRLLTYPIGAEPPPPATPLGPIKLEVGGIVRDVSHLTFAQKEEVMRSGKMPEDPAPQIEGARFTPHVKRMSE